MAIFSGRKETLDCFREEEKERGKRVRGANKKIKQGEEEGALYFYVHTSSALSLTHIHAYM